MSASLIAVTPLSHKTAQIRSTIASLAVLKAEVDSHRAALLRREAGLSHDRTKLKHQQRLLAARKGSGALRNQAAVWTTLPAYFSHTTSVLMPFETSRAVIAAAAS